MEVMACRELVSADGSDALQGEVSADGSGGMQRCSSCGWKRWLA
jgi:hypothetical protein